MAKVSIIKCSNYQHDKVRYALERHFELLGGLKKFVSKSDRVLVKPNLIAPKGPECPAQTNGAVILAVCEILTDFGARPFVADSPAWADTKTCVKALGIDNELKKLGVEIAQLNKPVKRKLSSGHKIGISSLVLDADKIINLPKLKAHQQLIATVAVKNMFGTVSGKAKAIWHYRKGGRFEDFCSMLIDVYKLTAPVITIIDAIVAMEGAGPINGTQKKLGWLIGSEDPIAAEIICCKLAGIDSGKLPIVTTAKKMGFSCCDEEKIKILGDKPQLPEMPIVVPPQVPLRFTPYRILKSISKQILMLAKAKKKE